MPMRFRKLTSTIFCKAFFLKHSGLLFDGSKPVLFCGRFFGRVWLLDVRYG